MLDVENTNGMWQSLESAYRERGGQTEAEKDNSSPLLTNLALEQLIRFAGNPYTRFASQFLEENLRFLDSQKSFFSKEALKATSFSPFKAFQESMKYWTK